jgi:hypothetical protein
MMEWTEKKVRKMKRNVEEKKRDRRRARMEKKDAKIETDSAKKSLATGHHHQQQQQQEGGQEEQQEQLPVKRGMEKIREKWGRRRQTSTSADAMEAGRVTGADSMAKEMEATERRDMVMP